MPLNPTPIPQTPEFQPNAARPPSAPAVNPQLPLAQTSRPMGAPRLGVPSAMDTKPTQVSTAMSPANAAPVAPPTPLPLATAPGATPYANMGTTIPGTDTDYTNKTITPGAGVDRLALAKSNWENFAQSTDPEYKATIRDANTAAAGRGQIGSGMLRGRLGDISTTRSRDLQTAQNSFLNQATEGTIGDSYANLGIAQQQQGRQDDQQRTAFDQKQREQAMQEALRNGDFQRYYQLLQAGNAGNPSDTQLQLAGNYGAQASAAGQSAGQLAGSAVNPYPGQGRI